jgi:hypothetical protein
MDESRLRVSDAEREAVVTRLQDALAEGRLTPEEFSERLDRVYAARTRGELERLAADLPAGPLPQPAAARGVARRPSVDRTPARPDRSSRALRAAWAAWGVAVSVNVVIWFLVWVSSGEPAYFWPMWVAGPWGGVLVALTVAARMGRQR